MYVDSVGAYNGPAFLGWRRREQRSLRLFCRKIFACFSFVSAGLVDSFECHSDASFKLSLIVLVGSSRSRKGGVPAETGRYSSHERLTEGE